MDSYVTHNGKGDRSLSALLAVVILASLSALYAPWALVATHMVTQNDHGAPGVAHTPPTGTMSFGRALDELARRR